MFGDDTLAQMVWSFVARMDELDDDEAPEATIERLRRSMDSGRYPGGMEPVAAELQVPWPVQADVLAASAWAGRARWALIQRDKAVRLAVAAGRSKRSVALAIGASPMAVDRIIDRGSADNTRW